MSKTNIEWATEVWNPTTGCNKVSQGCKHCYAEGMHKRLAGMGQQKYQQPFLDGVVEHPEALQLPLKWKKPQRVFVNSMSDLFHEDVSFDFINAVFSVMSDIDQHTYMVLTKRPQRMLDFFKWKSNQFGIRWQPKENVWLGVSLENQEAAYERIPLLLQAPAAVRFLSCEPLLGPVKLPLPLERAGGEAIHWVICGGESGNNARPMHPDWARSLRDQCAAAGVPFFFKQWGEFAPGSDYETSAKHYAVLTNGDRVQINSRQPGLMAKYQAEEWNSLSPTIMRKIGKHNARRLLDGVEHNAFPHTEKEMAI